jgi:DNA helicase-2/ATP-dependent DNA helicase PcrA
LSYLRCISTSGCSLRPAMEGIMKAILKALRLESVVNPNTDTAFTRTTLWDYLKENEAEEYDRWRGFVYMWIVALRKGLRDEVHAEMKSAVPGMLAIFGKALKVAADFVNGADVTPIAESSQGAASGNWVNHHGFDIEVASVHMVKGQTHTATLYLETAYYTDGRGASAKSYESQRLAAQFLGNPMNENEKGMRVKQSAKMVYVGLSRPTHLLCVAVHESHFNQYLGNIKDAGWDVIPIRSQGNTAGT